jgi:hypothetical protein
MMFFMRSYNPKKKTQFETKKSTRYAKTQLDRSSVENVKMFTPKSLK